jgi:hypothetical protein
VGQATLKFPKISIAKLDYGAENVITAGNPMGHVFEIQVKSRGRIQIPNYVRLAMNLKPGDWVRLKLEKIEKKKEA